MGLVNNTGVTLPTDGGARLRAENHQINKMCLLGSLLETDTEIIAWHPSKGYQLPVVRYQCQGVSFTLRDNLHDTNVLVESDFEIDVSLDFFYRRLDYEWYVEQMGKKAGYTFRDWSEEELNDPRILRVKTGKGWSSVSAEEKDVWTIRLTSTEWYTGWSSGSLLHVGPVPFGLQSSFYLAPKAYAEGIPGNPPPPCYGPSKRFLSCFNWPEAAGTCLKLMSLVAQLKHEDEVKSA